MLDGGIADSIPLEYAMQQGYEKAVVILTRNSVYNRTMDLIERLEDEGRITVIRPTKAVVVGRMEKDTDKLRALYDEGYSEAEKAISLMVNR